MALKRYKTVLHYNIILGWNYLVGNIVVIFSIRFEVIEMQ